MPTYLSPGVYVEEVKDGSRPIEGVGTAVAAFVGFAARGPVDEPTLVTNWNQFTRTFGEFVEGAYLAHAVYGYFLNGGGACYIVRVGEGGASPSTRKQKELSAGPQAMVGGYSVRALDGVTDNGRGPITVEVADPTGEEPPEGSFTLVVKRGTRTEETFDRVTTAPGKDNVVTAVAERSTLIRLEETATGAALARPEAGTVVLDPAASPVPAAKRLTPLTYVGDVASRTGLGALEAVDEITMVAAPDLMAAYEQGAVDLDAVHSVQLAMIAHCELMGDRMAILDPPPGLTPQQVRDWRVDGARFDSPFAALYYPWPKVHDPATNTTTPVPPSGHMAGVWARNDEARGVHKAPANEVIRGAVSLQTQITKAEHDLLNPIGVNCVRAFAGRGLRVWGARTLSSDPSWRYLNVRRLFNYLEESILAGTQWVVFEPNDDALWARIRRTVGSFLVNEWRKGALFGLTPDEAFYVKCDRETNSSEGIDAGQVVCEIGIAPSKPAEFVVFRLAQFSGGTSIVSE